MSRYAPDGSSGGVANSSLARCVLIPANHLSAMLADASTSFFSKLVRSEDADSVLNLLDIDRA
jgi:hypothetical protein